MTRTERNQYPAALVKDRHSRSAVNDGDRKQGAGAHNWGSFRQEGEYETQAQADAALDRTAQTADDGEMFEMENEVGELISKKAGNGDHENLQNGTGGEEVGEGENVNAVNKDLMREAIATSPADSFTSEKGGNTGGVQIKGRRMSNVSDEERERARVYREGVMNKGGPVSLANIARTSFGVASPPNGNAFGTSPTKLKNSV